MEKELEAYLHEHIPLSKAMGVCVERLILNELFFWLLLLRILITSKRFLGEACMQ